MKEDLFFNYEIPSINLAEFDLGGVLYHANYFHLYERCREAFLTQEKLPYHQLVESGAHLAVIESHQNFILPVYYGDSLNIRLSIEELKGSSLKCCYEIFNSKSETPIHSAWTRLVYVEKSGNSFKPRKFPKDLLAIFEGLSKTSH